MESSFKLNNTYGIRMIDIGSPEVGNSGWRLIDTRKQRLADRETKIAPRSGRGGPD